MRLTLHLIFCLLYLWTDLTIVRGEQEKGLRHRDLGHFDPPAEENVDPDDVGDLSGGGDTDVTDSTTPATTGATSPGDGAGTTTVATTPATTTTSSTTTTTPDVISAAERGDELSADDGISIGGAIGIGLAGAVSILFVTYMTMRSRG